MTVSFRSSFLRVLLVLFICGVAPLWAKEITITVPPDSSAIPLMVLEAKQKEWLPNDMRIKIIKWPLGDPCAQRVIVALKTADLGLLELQEGGYLYTQGFGHLRLAGVSGELIRRSTFRTQLPLETPDKAFGNGLWIIRNGRNADAVLHGLERASNYINQTANRLKVAKIIAAGFHANFDTALNPEVLESILAQHILTPGFENPQAYMRQVKKQWATDSVFPDDSIFSRPKSLEIISLNQNR